MNTWWLVGYTEPDVVACPPPRPDAPNTPTTKEPIREPPKKYSFNERGLDSRSSVSLHSKAVVGGCQTSNGLDAEGQGRCGSPSLVGGSNALVKRHSSLYATSSYHSLLSVNGDGEKIKLKHSTPLQGSGSATELAPAMTSVASVARSSGSAFGIRHSIPNVPQIKVNSTPTGSRRVTYPTVESIGLGISREPGKPSRLSQTSLSSRDTKQLAVMPLDDK